VLEQQVAQRAGDGHLAAAVLGFRFDLLAVDAIPARLDADHAGREVDPVPLERLELAEAQPRVERSALQRPVAQLERREQCHRVLKRWYADAVARTAYSRHVDLACRVDREVAAVDEAPVDRSQRQDRALHCHRREILRDEAVDEILHIGSTNIGDLPGAEHGEHLCASCHPHVSIQSFELRVARV